MKTLHDVKQSGSAIDWLIVKMGNRSTELISTFLEDLKRAKELESQELEEAYVAGIQNAKQKLKSTARSCA